MVNKHSDPRAGPSLVTRRTVLKAAGTGLGLFFVTSLAGRPFAVQATAAAGSDALLPPVDIPQFVSELLIPPVMPRAGTAVLRGGKNADYYEISVRQFEQQILPPSLPTTTVWGYGPVAARGGNAVMLHNAPSLTIEATWRAPGPGQMVNELTGENNEFLPHLLPVDPTLHWANPPGGTTGRDGRPTFERTPGPYRGPVPLVTHVHGSVGVGDESDGYPEAWYLPGPGTSRTTMPARAPGTSSSAARPCPGSGWAGARATRSPSTRTINAPRPLWYHDHTLGMTRLNVYAGPAGFFLLRGGPEGDNAVLDARTGTPAVLPGPAPRQLTATIPARRTSRCRSPCRTAPSPPTAHCSTRTHVPSSTKRRSVHPRRGHPADLEPRILRQHYDGQRQHLAVPHRRATALPLPATERMPRPLPDSGLQPDPWVRSVADRVRRRIPAHAGQPHRRPCGQLLLGPAERADVILDFTGVPLGRFRDRQHRTRRTVRRRPTRPGLRHRRPDHHRTGPRVTGCARRRSRSHHTTPISRPAHRARHWSPIPCADSPSSRRCP